MRGMERDEREGRAGFELHPRRGWADAGENQEDGGEEMVGFPEMGMGAVTGTGAGEGEDERGAVLTREAEAGKYGPCLFFGPGGERCGRAALANGFCGRHQAGAAGAAGEGRDETDPGAAARRKKILGVVIGIAGVLWPVLAALVNEIMRWMHSH